MSLDGQPELIGALSDAQRDLLNFWPKTKEDIENMAAVSADLAIVAR